MVDISISYEGIRPISYLIISKRYRIHKYLVSDKYDNLFILPNCTEKRSVSFKQLIPFINGNKEAINYKRSNVSLEQLKEREYKVNELFLLPANIGI